MRISPVFAIPLLAFAMPPASAQAPAKVEVRLSNFKFTPGTIVLDHGRPYVLRLVNLADGGHDFTARDFFAAAAVAPDDRRWVIEGAVEVAPGQIREIRLTAPSPGSYKLKCTHAFHKMMGMSGTIVVR